MNKTKFLLHVLALVACLMCSLGASAAEAYACYTSSNTTLTFYYDGQRSSRTGTTYDLNTGFSYPGWYSDGTMTSVTRVVFDPAFASARPTSTRSWFHDMTKLSSITGMQYLNTEEVTAMSSMFQSCTLASLDMSHFNTSKVTSMMGMFRGCNRLKSLDLSSFNTSSVTNMQAMFMSCSALTSVDLRSFNTSSVTLMVQMFSDCKKLYTVYVGNGWSTAAVTSSSNMFSNCTSLVGGQGTTYDASHVDKAYAHIDGGTSNPGYFCDPNASATTYACYTPDNTTLTFYYDNQRMSREGTTYDLNTGSNNPGWYSDGTYNNVTKVVFNSSFVSARPTTTHGWFCHMRNLTSITDLNFLNTSEVTNMSVMFASCIGLTTLDVSGFNTSKVTEMISMFSGCSDLTSLDVSNFNTSNVTDMSYMFYYCPRLTSLDVSQFNTSKVTEMDGMFYYCDGLTSLDLSSFNTSKVWRMDGMFGECSGLTTIYAGSGWSTAAVIKSDNMFTNCTSLMGGQGTTYDASHVDAAYAHIDGGTANPGYLFDSNAEAYACYTPGNTTLTFYCDNYRSTRAGTTHDLNNATIVPTWYRNNTYKSVTNVVFDPSFAGARPTCTVSWFDHMTNLISITGMEYLNTSEVTDMSTMFRGCTGLTSLDLRNFNTAKVTDMGGLFDGCTGLTSLNLRNFNTAKVTALGVMFQGCSNLTTIYVSDQWSTAAVTVDYNMFYGCTSLVGGQGTTYSAINVGKAYAHIDGGTANPGYLTEFKEAYACHTYWNTLTFYYDGQRATRSVTTYDLNTGYSRPGWYSDSTNASVTRVVFDPSFADARPTTTGSWFEGMTKLKTITGIKEYLNTSEVTVMYRMFLGCSSLTSLDLRNFNTAKVTDMSWMFTDCNALTSLNLSGLNTSNVTDMGSMFSGCTGLTSLDVNGFNTAKVTDMRNMFYGCTGLTTLAVDGFNTAQVTYMSLMFGNCTNLTSLDLSGFNTAKVTNMSGMFYYCGNLKTICADSGWSTGAVTSSNSMFMGCTSLVGGMGTTYDANHVDAAYAHIDGGTANPGYLTDVNAVAPSVRGDVDGDGIVNIDDVTALIDILLSGAAAPAGADCDGDGKVNIDDVTTMIDYLLSGSWN